MRLLTNDEAMANLHMVPALSQHQFGSTTLKTETLHKFADAGALTVSVLADFPQPDEEMPDWVPFTQGGVPQYIPRGHLMNWFMSRKGFDDLCAGTKLADVTPWQLGDGEAYIFVASVISTVRNGIARLFVEQGQMIEKHPAFPHLKEVMWYTRSAKGAALTEYFQGHAAGRAIHVKYDNGTTQDVPIYTLSVADWNKHIDGVVGKLIGIEANFSETIAEARKKMKDGL